MRLEKTKLWRPKTAAELIRDRRRRSLARFSPVRPAVMALGFATIVAGAGVLVGNPRLNRPPMPVSKGIGLFCFLAPASFVVLYLWQAWFGPLITKPKLWICTTCFELHTERGRGFCRCGGVLQNADAWTNNRCPKCGYDLRESSRCPECGYVP